MKTVQIETHDGNTFVENVENYNAAELNEMLNNDKLNTVVLGDLVISRINIKSVKPIQEVNPEVE